MKNCNFEHRIVFNCAIKLFSLCGAVLVIVLVLLFIFKKTFFLYAAIGCTLIFLLLLYFFRNPNRLAERNDRYILCPADGTVVSIEQNVSDKETGNRVNKIAIFLSIFNVHINRIPVSGKVIKIKEDKGSFLPAFLANASKRNYSKTVVINGKIRVSVKQISGVIARKIINDLYVDKTVVQGDAYGMILMGSRVEVTFPENVKILCKKGDIVKAGISKLGEIPA